ncbi:MAG: lipid A biosynthesis acyltransferase [Chitinophagaceae bacterium]|nr:lipid A biosynthesis acyltransferase [Chitinophagaceae bacterium]
MYYFVYGIFWLLSLLPWRVLYLISDAIYGLVFYILKYRRDVVLSNLAMAFPEKSEEERWKIAKKFYHNLLDTFMETIKMLSASEAALSKRFVANWEAVNQFYPSGRSIQLHAGHNFNWELCNVSCPINLRYPFLGVYMPMTNKLFERLFLKLRSRFGTKLLRATHMKEDFQIYKDAPYVLALAADQNPGNPASGWWFDFFGRPAPFVKGPARGAIGNNTVVIFAFIHKLKRGYYETVFTVATEEPTRMTEQELTAKFVEYLENVIRRYPEMWLWSHRRWKWVWKEEFGEVRHPKTFKV